MRWTKALIPTLKENPEAAEVKSHRLMMRAGLIRKLASGTYSYLPLGLRALQKAERIIREEMDRAGALEVLLPAIHPKEIWTESGRFDILGEDMIHFKDRHGRENVLGPTHEEVITDLARREIRSYRQLPMALYQIQTKFRDEMRPRSGIIRSREFIMKDAYSFHPDEACLDRTYNRMKEVYSRIFTRCGLEFHIVEADPGAMGGSGSQEFVLFSDAGEDRMVQTGHDGPVVSVEMAERKLKGLSLPQNAAGRFKKIHTPGQCSVEAVAKTAGKKPSDLMKTMIYEADAEVFAVLVRGDHEVSDYKVKKWIHPKARLASIDTIEKAHSAFGFSGPRGLKIPLYADEDVLSMKDFVVGANEKDYHWVNFNLGDMPAAKAGDFRQVVEGDKSPDGQPLFFKTAIELGHIFKLNMRYSVPMKAHYLDKDGKEKPLVMGCYGIGVNRILAAAVEQCADDKGIIWPKNISPYQVLVTVIDAKDAESQQIAEQIEVSRELAAQRVDILVDDRSDTAGVKFYDADLVGIPLRVVLGPKNLKLDKAEIKIRKSGEVLLVDKKSIIPEILKHLDKIA
ncbi:MAG: proline--tRNA ligase [Candidatus Omnitrophica bacterium]|nr:proline--tRNA ligase [Candidatus Omnitrophota bacterium]